MQEVQAIDWNIIQSLYLQGLTPKQIELETGVKAGQVSVRANRKGWTAALSETKSKLQARNDAILADNEPLTKQSQRVRSGLASVLERSIDKLEQLSFKTPKAALKANQELESVVRNAKTVFGWSEGQSSPSVRIAIMSQTTTIEQGETKALPSIEVETMVEVQPKALP